MNYLLDTNILLIYLRDSDYTKIIDEKFNPLGTGNLVVVSVVTLGEIRSIAIQNNWGKKRLNYLELLTNQFLIAEINVESIINRYAEIDAFS